MGFSKYFQLSTLKSNITNFKDYARQPLAISRPLIGGVLRTYADAFYDMCHIKSTGNIVKVLTAFVATGTTTGITPVVLLTDGNHFVLQKNRAYSFIVKVFGMVGNLDTGYAKEIRGVIAIGATNGTAILLAPAVETIILDKSDGFTAIATADTTNGALSITVTGSASLSMLWTASIEILEL